MGRESFRFRHLTSSPLVRTALAELNGQLSHRMVSGNDSSLSQLTRLPSPFTRVGPARRAGSDNWAICCLNAATLCIAVRHQSRLRDLNALPIPLSRSRGENPVKCFKQDRTITSGTACAGNGIFALAPTERQSACHGCEPVGPLFCRLKPLLGGDRFARTKSVAAYRGFANPIMP